jgi:hypothetical protein
VEVECADAVDVVEGIERELGAVLLFFLLLLLVIGIGIGADGKGRGGMKGGIDISPKTTSIDRPIKRLLGSRTGSSGLRPVQLCLRIHII